MSKITLAWQCPHCGKNLDLKRLRRNRSNFSKGANGIFVREKKLRCYECDGDVIISGEIRLVLFVFFAISIGLTLVFFLGIPTVIAAPLTLIAVLFVARSIVKVSPIYPQSD